MTEFGAMTNSTTSIENMHFLTGQSDMHLASWTYWQFKGLRRLAPCSPASRPRRS